MVAQVNAVLDDPRFAPLFAPGSRAEVPIVGRIARPGRPDIAVSGLIDRLAVTDDAVLIADYKTNRPPPRRPQDAPAYVAQLALYRAVLAKLYPGRQVRAALLWTEGPDLMEIPATMLDEALTRVTST
jgi:ATP-dependent helicase/nuclease subunit A